MSFRAGDTVVFDPTNFNPEFWNNLSKRQQPQAGLVISKAVDDGLLPLIKKGRSQSNHQLYERT